MLSWISSVSTSLSVRMWSICLYFCLYQTTILTHGDIDPGFFLTDWAACSRLSSATLAPLSPTTPLLVHLHLRTVHPPALDLCTRPKLQKSPHEAARMSTVPLHLGRGFLRLPGPLSLLPGWPELKASMLPAATRSRPLVPQPCFSRVCMVTYSRWSWQELTPSLLPAEAPSWGLLLRTFSQEAIPEFRPPSAKMSSLPYHAPRCHLRFTSSSPATATCTSARRMLAPSTRRSTRKSWLMVAIRLLFWAHQTPEETRRSKASLNLGFWVWTPTEWFLTAVTKQINTN